MPDALDQRVKAAAPVTVLAKWRATGAVGDRSFRAGKEGTEVDPPLTLEPAQGGKIEPAVDQDLPAFHVASVKNRRAGPGRVAQHSHPYPVGITQGEHRCSQPVFSAQDSARARSTKLRAANGPFRHRLHIAINGTGGERHNEAPTCRFGAG